MLRLGDFVNRQAIGLELSVFKALAFLFEPNLPYILLPDRSKGHSPGGSPDNRDPGIN
jgi:hypothetical protein